MCSEKICVYTCITGDYDKLQPIYQEEGIDYICFTSNKKLQSDDWKIIYIEDDNHLGNMMLSRKIKILGHEYLRERYDISIWVDGAIQVRNKIKEFLNLYCDMEYYNMACFKHSVRDCVYEEAVACIIGRKEKKENIIPLLDRLKEEKFPNHFGLAECGVLIRRHNNTLVMDTMKVWFDLMVNYVKRDQLSFPYCLNKMDLKVKWIDLNVHENPWFCAKAHKRSKQIEACRIIYGKPESVYSCIYEDYKIDEHEEKIRVQFTIPDTCNRMMINFGTHFGRVLYNFQIKGLNVTEITYSGVSILQYHVFDNEDLVIRILGEFKLGQKAEVSFSLSKTGEIADQYYQDAFLDKYYYEKRVSNITIQTLKQQVDELNQQYKEMKYKCFKMKEELRPYKELSRSPLFDKIRPLCERQDLKTKVIRKMILRGY